MAGIFDDLFDLFRENQDVINLGSGIASYFQDRNEGRSYQNFAQGGVVDPFGAANRNAFQQKLHALYQSPDYIENLPGYEFARGQGEKAINRQAAARGEFFSGNAMHQLTQFNQGLAGQFYEDEAKRLERLSGSGFAPNATAGANLYAQGGALRTNALGQIGAGAKEGAGIGNLLTNAASVATKIPGVSESLGIPGVQDILGKIPGLEGIFGGGAGASGAISAAGGLTGGVQGLGALSPTLQAAAGGPLGGAWGSGVAAQLGAGGAGAAGVGTAAGLSEAAAGLGYAGTSAAGGAGGAAAGSGALAGGLGTVLGAAAPLALAYFGMSRVRAKAKAQKQFMAPILERIYKTKATAVPGLDGVKGRKFSSPHGDFYTLADWSADAHGNGRALGAAYDPKTKQFGSYGMSGFYSPIASDGSQGWGSAVAENAFNPTPEGRQNAVKIHDTWKARQEELGNISYGD